MTTTNFLVPLPEQIDEWFDDAVRLNSTPKYYIARQAAQWGADQELEACCEWLYMNGYNHVISARLRDARRPEPPSLKEQALEQLRRVNAVLQFQATGGETSVIRRALEALDG